MGSVYVRAGQDTIKPGEDRLNRTCRTCAFLGRTRFRKSSRQYGRIIWWCKHKRYLGSTKEGKMVSSQSLLLGCKKHQTKVERRAANDVIRKKILSDTAAARVLKKSW